MLVSEKKLRSMVHEILSESLLKEEALRDEKGSTFDVTPTGSVKLVSRGPGVTGRSALPYTFPNDRAPLVINALLKTNPSNPTLLAAQKALGSGSSATNVSKGSVGLSSGGSFGSSGSSSSGGSTSDKGTADEVAKLNFPPGKGIIVVNRHDFFPLDSISPMASKAVSALVGQGHASVIVVNPNTGKGYRFDFGRYDEAKSCKDDRWITQAGNALFGKEEFNKMGIHTMGIALTHEVRELAKVSKDGTQIENLKSFCASSLWGKERSGESDAVVIPVSDINGALSFAKSMVGKCSPYALPGAGLLTTQDTMNCGIFAQRVLQAGKPDQLISVQARTLFDTPDSLYETAAGMGYQTAHF